MFIVKMIFAVLVTIPIVILGMKLITLYYEKNIGNGGNTNEQRTVHHDRGTGRRR